MGRESVCSLERILKSARKGARADGDWLMDGEKGARFGSRAGRQEMRGRAEETRRVSVGNVGVFPVFTQDRRWFKRAHSDTYQSAALPARAGKGHFGVSCQFLATATGSLYHQCMCLAWFTVFFFLHWRWSCTFVLSTPVSIVFL